MCSHLLCILIQKKMYLMTLRMILIIHTWWVTAIILRCTNLMEDTSKMWETINLVMVGTITLIYKWCMVDNTLNNNTSNSNSIRWLITLLVMIILHTRCLLQQPLQMLAITFKEASLMLSIIKDVTTSSSITTIRLSSIRIISPITRIKTATT